MISPRQRITFMVLSQRDFAEGELRVLKKCSKLREKGEERIDLQDTQGTAVPSREHR
jgi:hypothetical protein